MSFVILLNTFWRIHFLVNGQHWSVFRGEKFNMKSCLCVCVCVWVCLGLLGLEGLRGIFFFCSSVHLVTLRSLSLSVASTGEGVWEAKHNKQGQEELTRSWETRPRMFLHMLGKQAHQKLRDCGRTGSRQALKKNCGQSGLQWCCCGNENES